MYKIKKTVTAKSDITKPVSVSTEAKYSAKDVYDLLSSLDELKEKRLSRPKITALTNSP